MRPFESDRLGGERFGIDEGLDLKRESGVLGAPQCHVQIRDQTLQSHGMKLQGIVRQATSVQGCAPLQRSDPE